MTHLMKHTTIGMLTLSCVLLTSTALPAATAAADNARGNPAVAAALAVHNVVWDSPSKDAHGSMPLGNGDVGINAWVDEMGDLVFYVSKTDAWDENARLCKIGRVRVKFDPPLTPKDGFRQELKLIDGVIQIESKIQNQPAKISLWVDANQPVVRVDAEVGVPVSCRAEVELWRLRERPLDPQEDYGYGDDKSPIAVASKLTVLPDVVATSAAPQVVWYHRNTRSLYPVCLQVQHLESLKGKFTDPLLDLTFGASLRGVDMVKDGGKAIKSSKPAKRQQLAVTVLAERTATPEAWLKNLEKVEKAALQPGFEQARLTTTVWWQAFWNRSWVFVEENAEAAKAGGTPASPSLVTQGYVLQRFMNAGSGRGGSPIKFNGSIFCVEKVPGASPTTADGDPDWRNWGGSYWFQNTRLSYWPMLASGDFDMLDPWFRMYRDALPLSKARMQEIYKFTDAASFQETMNFWGMPNNRDYGWTHGGPEPGNVCIHRYWSGGMELTAFMLDLYDFKQDPKFVKDTLVPLADPIIAFYDQYWKKRDPNGKIIFDPAQSLEAMPWTINPMPEVAGLRFILPRLLALPPTLTTEAQRTRWTRMLKEMPPLPVAEVKGIKLLRPSAQSGVEASENPELYAVFPYRIFGVGKPDLDLARATYNKRFSRNNFGWCQDSIQAACLGLGEEAAKQVSERAKRINGGYRFPAMWTGFDSIPDQDHGVNILTTVQNMLLQADGNKIHVLPAWPKNWNVSFKLHAPSNTTVEGVVKAGKLEQLKITPESRAKDVVNLLGK
jgi:alpha-L-fucosidase 2